jgi:transcriptional regulator with PAS, ATPase and Fis domain
VTSGNCFALVVEDPRLASAVQTQVARVLGRAPLLCPFGTIRNHLGRDTDGLLLIVAGSPAEQELATRLVQDVSLQKHPAVLVLMVVDPKGDALAALDPYVCRRLRWPEEAESLRQILKERSGRGGEFIGTRTEALEETISRRLLAQTPSLLPLVDRIALAAAHDVTVLLTGETGTGKTFLARLMHESSPRKQHRFLAVPCGALAANLVESEFFGHVKGAFTGADRNKVGKFAAVGQGTLLLDEIDTLPLEQQAGLLRVIETGEYEPVGSNETHVSTARLIVASNLHLEDAVERGKFRQDLYYRLNVMSFHLPPLRERVQDIAPLVRGMATRFNHKFHKQLFDIGPEAMAALESFPWPGNLRQLENVIQHAVLMSSGPEVLLQHLPPQIQEHAQLLGGNGGSLAADDLQHNRQLIERNVIQRVLVNCGYSRARAADALNISRVTLYKKMKKYGLMEVPSQEGRWRVAGGE